MRKLSLCQLIAYLSVDVARTRIGIWIRMRIRALVGILRG
jgi:hypothetical protein